MARQIMITFDGEAGNYEAVTDEIIDKNYQLTRNGINPSFTIPPIEKSWTSNNFELTRQDDPQPLVAQLEPATLLPDIIRESLTKLTQKERQDLYRLLHDAFGCRM